MNKKDLQSSLLKCLINNKTLYTLMRIIDFLEAFFVRENS
jgi:hypothetical protein